MKSLQDLPLGDGERRPKKRLKTEHVPVHVPIPIFDFMLQVAEELDIETGPFVQEGLDDDTNQRIDHYSADDNLPSDEDFDSEKDDDFEQEQDFDRDPYLLRPRKHKPASELTLTEVEKLHEEVRLFREEACKSVELGDRKPTFYTYMQLKVTEGMGQLFSGTPQTKEAEKYLAKSGEEAESSEFSLLSLDFGPKPEKPAKGKAPNLERDRIAKNKQGPHSLAHVLIEEMMKEAAPDDPELDPLIRWQNLERAFVTQVDTPEDFRETVMDELGEEDDELPEKTKLRIAHAVSRHQEMFNGLEACFNGAYASLRLVKLGKYGKPKSDTYKDWLEEDLKEFVFARNLLAEIMELAPFGSYAWQREGGATPEELKGKGERRKRFLEALAKVKETRGTDGWRAAIVEFAHVMAGFIDGASGKFESEEAYKAFLRLRLELVVSSDYSDLFLEELLSFKD